jgi:predicted O-linked N-acetylglucosamine transferase (SPINDLY family)
MSLIGSKGSARREAARKAETDGDLANAERLLRAALAVRPGDSNTTLALADFLARRRRFSEAEAYYKKLLKAFPNEPALLNSFAVLKHMTGRRDEAIGLWQRVHTAQPTVASPLINIGLALREAGDTAGAIAKFERALAIDPTAFEAHYNLGVTYYHGRQYEAAIGSLDAALRLRPGHARAAAMLAQASQAVCDWGHLDQMMPTLRAESAKARDSKACAVTPWFSLRLPFDSTTRRAIAASAARPYEDMAASQAARLGFGFAPAAKEKLTIGYCSSDFRDHPILQLTAGMYRRHDRNRYRIIGYPVKAPTAEAQEILSNGCDAVVDLSRLSDTQAAQHIYADKVDILVDISVVGEATRPEILAMRPAPVQVSWLNYAGTFSGRLYDYLIGDPVVTPLEHATDYLEAIVQMPHSYQINNCDQPIAASPQRAAEGLPDGAFVFACFCGGEKIEREVFSHWMEILRQCQGSILWLFGESPTMQTNLRRAASLQGIDPTRLVFAVRQPKAQHLGRIALADLHFDTGTYGAHTTGSDALWAGVPLLSVIGDAFPSRVGASLLYAINLPELVVADWDAYVRLAINLAQDPAHLAAVRQKLGANRISTPLFDTARSVHDLEALYERMWAARISGAERLPIKP